MKIALRTIISALLLLNGTGAFYGGWNLMRYPDGSSLQMSLDYLRYSPFTDYLIPGLILFTANGLLSLWVLVLLFLKHKQLPLWVIAQGLVLTGWIGIQIWMVHDVYYLHVIMGLTGLLLVVCGGLLLRREKLDLP